MTILEYHRPRTIDEALNLLARPTPLTLPLAGGSALNRPSAEAFAAVDLQSLGLDQAEKRGNTLILGATLTLQAMLDVPDLPPALLKAVQHEASYNLRQVATVAGTLIAADGRSPITTALLALDATLTWRSAESQGSTSLGDLLPVRRRDLRRRLVTQVSLPVNARLAYEYVARTPADRPIVCAAVAAWPSGRVRVALGGFGDAPLLALDGPEESGVEAAVRNAYCQAADDWATAEYRQEAAAVLALRGLQHVRGMKDVV